jgi:signal transduction histidine kinase/DNA-binding response OmpR family regulator/HPt (histidine-containing phosphotransfer) domain-containing protein
METMPGFGNVFGRASLSRKLTGLGVLTSTIALLVAGAVLLAADVSTSHQRLVSDTAMRAEALAQNGSAPLAFRDAQSAAEVLATVSLQDHAMSAAIFNPDGSVFARYDRPSMHAPGLEASFTLAAGEQASWSRFVTGGLVVGRPIRVNGEIIGTVMLTSDLDDVWLRAFDFGRIIGAAVFGAFLLAIGLAYALQRVISRPLLALTAVARDIARDGRYDRRAIGDGDGEIGELINGFNGMLSEIQQRDAQLQQQHFELERTVEGRTRELRTANTELVTSRDKAMEASRAKSEFLANMSHEIRTPMNGIIGMTELALMSGPDDQLRDYLTTVKTSADSLLTILNDILDFSKIESRKLELEAIPFSVRELVVETLKPLAMKAEQTGIELLCDIDPAISDRVIGDRLRLRQVLSNLVGNAIKFTAAGHVLVEVRERVRTGNRTTLHFQVTDTGIGIPADKHETIFEAFSQADGSTTRRFGGTGLGLTISATLVRLMGGEIWLESRPDAGSTFHFTTSFECDAAPQPSLLPEPLLADLRVLIVDDNPVNRRILMAQLSRWHTRPTAVGDGASAIATLAEAAAERRPFELVLLDANMPGMDGFDVAEQIAARQDLAGATIMMLTSSGRYGDVGRCGALGIAAYLTKPVGADDLHAAIGRVLRGGTRSIAAIDAADTPPAISRPRALRVLLAEDNVVNQRVAVGMLSARGHSVTVANNGAEALAALAGGTFDLVLMDVQMPVMGGLEATAEIRRRERASGAHVRIVAMTAHAMRGDRDRCLAAGMDGYLSKPIDPQTLFAVVEQDAAAPIQLEPAAPAGPRTPVDMDAVMRRLSGDQNLFQEVAQLFLEDCPRRLENIDAAVASADLGQIRSAAHALKGAAATLSAAGLVAAAGALEACGSDGRVLEAGAAAGQVAIEARRVMAFFRSQLAMEPASCGSAVCVS